MAPDFNNSKLKLNSHSLTWMLNGRYCILGYSGCKSGELKLIDIVKL